MSQSISEDLPKKKNGKSKPQTIELNGKKIPARISIGSLKRVKEEIGLTLYGDDTAAMLEFAIDPVVTMEVCWSLWKPQLEKNNIEVDDFEELCGSEEIAAMRAEVIKQMRGFSEYWKILDTMLTEIQSGNLDGVVQMAADIQAAGKAASGPSSSQPQQSSDSTSPTTP